MVNEALTSSERMMTPDVVITGEAVALEVRAASAGLRILSGLIDYTLYSGGLIMTLITLFTLSFPTAEAPSDAVQAVVAGLVALLWMLVVPLSVEILSRGKSAGRLVTGTRVVRDDGGSIRMRHGLVRVLLAVIEIWLTYGVVATVACVVTRRGKRLGDLLAGTYVVHERSATLAAPPVLMPPELAAWAAQADLRALPRAVAHGGGWLPWALGSAVFAALTAVLGKIGITDVESNLGTAVRTGVVLVMAWMMVLVTGKRERVRRVPRDELGWIAASGLATGASWLCYFSALQKGPASLVVPIDKLSVLVTVVFCVIVLHERQGRRSLTGLALLVIGTALMVVA